MRNLTREHENEEDEEFKEDTPEINDTNESKISKGKTGESLIRSKLSKNMSLKVTQAVILSINTYKKYIISVGNKIQKKKGRCNYFNHISMISL